MMTECCIKGCDELVDADPFILDHGSETLGRKYAMCPDHFKGVMAPAVKVVNRLWTGTEGK